eukprot:745786-Hanusia_phi.AAC.2
MINYSNGGVPQNVSRPPPPPSMNVGCIHRAIADLSPPTPCPELGRKRRGVASLIQAGYRVELQLRIVLPFWRDKSNMYEWFNTNFRKKALERFKKRFMKKKKSHDESLRPMPNAHLCIRDSVLGLAGTRGNCWQERRTGRLTSSLATTSHTQLPVVTAEYIAFGWAPDGDTVVDWIPLHEIEYVAHCRVDELPSDSREQPVEIEYYDTNTKKLKRSVTYPDKHFRPQTEFKIKTIEDGFNSGRTYILKASSESECTDWMQTINEFLVNARKLWRKRLLFIQFKRKLANFHDSDGVQVFIALLIAANFAATVTQLELLPPKGSKVYQQLDQLDLSFTILFAVDLAVNMVANFWWKFWRNGWNVFDFIVEGGAKERGRGGGGGSREGGNNVLLYESELTQMVERVVI